MTSQDSRRTQILLITGLAGVGKSTLCWEISSRLAAVGVAHTAIESDELDRVFPLPTPDELESLRPGTTDVSAITLEAFWSPYRTLGHTRLVMSGVVLDLVEGQPLHYPSHSGCRDHGGTPSLHRGNAAGSIG